MRNDWDWPKSYEERRHSRNREGGLSYEYFQSSKYDFQNIPSPELKRIYIPELGMTVGAAISALKRSWRKYRWSKQDNEPTGDLSMRILRLQKGLGLVQSDFLIDEARQSGYTDNEINDEEVVSGIKV